MLCEQHSYFSMVPSKEGALLTLGLSNDDSLHMLLVVDQQTFTCAHTPATEPALSLAVGMRYRVAEKGTSRGHGSSS